MKKISVIIALAVIVIGGLYFFSGGQENGPQELKTVKASKGDIRREIVARGTVIPEVEVVVKSKAGGEITGFPYNEGDKIKKGEVIVTLDPKTEKSRANQSEANVRVARAKLEKARTSLKDAEIKLQRSRNLYKEGIISRQELDDAEISLEKAKSDLKLGEAELAQAQEALNEALERLADTEIKAPFTGTILKKYVEAGQVISSTLSSASEGTQIFSMANLDRIYVNAQVDEVDISRIKNGQEAEIAVDSLPGMSFSGRVERIAPKGKVERTVTVFDVVVLITGENKDILRPGMTSDIKVLTDVIRDATLVPNEAIRLKDAKSGVYVLKNGKPEFVFIKTGESDGVVTEVTEGVGPGAELVISGMKPEAPKPQRRRFFFF